MKAPFPWFGGKSQVAAAVWDRFGNVPNYVEPFAGSLAVLLDRPTIPKNETVNDKDAYIANFWLALKSDPEAVAHWAADPVNETMLHSRHKWLVVGGKNLQMRMDEDPEFYDARVAGWWVWGISQWIGSGWCSRPEWRGRTHASRARGIHGAHAADDRRPHVGRGGQGVHKKRPLLHKGGNGVHRKIPDLKGSKGVHGTSHQVPGLSGSRGIFRDPAGLFPQQEPSARLVEYFEDLAARLQSVRVCCGDWERVLGPSPTTKIGLTGIFLDPPYDMRIVGDKKKSGRDSNAPTDVLYNEHDNDLSAKVRAWAIAHGNDPLMRIAVCGYDSEHEFPASWECHAWKANGGYGNQSGSTAGKKNARRERIWFSPHCIKTPSLFTDFNEDL